MRNMGRMGIMGLCWLAMGVGAFGQTIAGWRIASTAWASNYVRGEALGKGDPGALVFDGATSGTRVSGGAFASIGSGNFSIWLRFRVPLALPTGVAAVAVGGTSASGTILDVSDSAYLRLESSGGVAKFRLTDGSAVNREVSVSNFLADQGGKVVDVFLVRDADAGTGNFYLGTKLKATGSTGWGSSIAATTFHLGNLAAGSIFNGEVYRAALFNLALTTSDLAEICANGMPNRFKWGATSATYTGDFSAGADSWAALNATVAGNIDSITDGSLSKNDTLRIYADGTSARHGATRTGLLTAGKSHRVTWDFYVPTANTTVDGSRLAYSTSGASLADYLTTGTWTAGKAIIGTALETDLAFGELTAAPVDTFSGANSVANDLLYVTNVKVYRLGALVDWDCGLGLGYQVPDRSTAKLHGLAAGGVTHRVEKRYGQVRGQTSTSGNQQLLGGVCLPTNGRIMSIAISSTGTATVSIGNVSGGAQIASGVSVVSGRQDVGTLVSRYSSTGNVWVNSSTSAVMDWTVSWDLVD